MAVIVLATIGLYMLPKAVVENDAIAEGEMEPERMTEEQPVGAVLSREIPEQWQAIIDRLREAMKRSSNNEKSFIFADSLANAFQNADFYDSAAHYASIVAQQRPNEKNFLRVADYYYEAFNGAEDRSLRWRWGGLAREYYSKALAENARLYEAKVKSGMTLIDSDSPMQGITMIREVLDDDPDNALAIESLGLLSITSGQFERAVERFEQLIALDKDNEQAHFYLGYSLAQLGKEEEAKVHFQRVIALDNNEELVRSSQEYLNSIQ